MITAPSFSHSLGLAHYLLLGFVFAKGLKSPLALEISDMLTESTNNMVSCIDKAGDWPPLVTLMSKNSNVEQLQSDIAEWFRENQPDAYELPGPPSASKLGCESGLRSDNDGNTPGESQIRANCRIFWMLCGACHLQNGLMCSIAKVTLVCAPPLCIRKFCCHITLENLGHISNVLIKCCQRPKNGQPAL